MEMKRLTYDAKGKHYCDYKTRDIINRLAECEIMLQKITEILDDWESDGGAFEMSESYWLNSIRKVIEDGSN